MHTRRQTLKAIAALATIQIVPSRVLGLNGQTAPSNEITKGIIGCGGISSSHLSMPGRLLALCDVDANHLKERMTEAKAEENKITGYRDFRELIARDDIDVVHIATPPHWHALMTIAAIKAGKHVWCEKPYSRTIGEGIAMMRAVEASQKMFRLNTWFRFQSGFYGMRSPVLQIKKAAMHGLLGWPLKATISKTTGFDWKFQWVGRTDLKEEPIPDFFDYDLWLGPAPKKPYNIHRTHQTFRGYWDYDGGGLGDMGQHYLDPVQYILNKDNEAPISVEIDADPQHPDAIGTWRRIEYTYADGCKIILDGEDRDKEAAFLEGPNGRILPRLESNIPDLRKKIDELPDPPAQITDFHQSIRTGEKFALNEVNAFWSGTLVNMGVTAHRLNRNLKFDSKTFQFDAPEANAYNNPKFREPWKL
jgi:predicted dehydrogenase